MAPAGGPLDRPAARVRSGAEKALFGGCNASLNRARASAASSPSQHPGLTDRPTVKPPECDPVRRRPSLGDCPASLIVPGLSVAVLIVAACRSSTLPRSGSAAEGRATRSAPSSSPAAP